MSAFDSKYQAYFCEENTWWACTELARPCYALFITSASKQVPIWAQRAAGSRDYVVWDYHVVAVYEAEGSWWVQDPDSTLPGAPYLHLASWLAGSFPYVFVGHEPLFRLVEAALYIEHFASDRSHMRSPDGAWIQEPPPWRALGEGMNLMRFVDIQDPFIGERLNLAELQAKFLAK